MQFYNLLDKLNEKFETKLYLDEVSFFKLDNELDIVLLSKNEKFDNEIKDYLYSELSQYGIKINIIIYYTLDIINKIQNIFPNIKYEIDDDNFIIFINHIKEQSFYESKKEFVEIINKLKHLNIELKYNLMEDNNKEFYQNLLIEKENNVKNEIKELANNINENIKTNSESIQHEGLFTYGFVKTAPAQFTNLEDLVEDTSKVKVKGKVYEFRINEKDKGAWIYFDLDDGYFAIKCKLWVKKEKLNAFLSSFKEDMGIVVSGVYKYDEFDRERLLFADSIEEVILPERLDLNEEKRIEFNIHTKYSMLESVVDVKSLIKKLKLWGHKSFGLTDLFNVQAYPEIYKEAKTNGIKVNLGLQTNILEDNISILTNFYNIDMKDKTYVVFDIETTGLSNFTNKIIEIGAVKIKNDKIVDLYQEFVNPKEGLTEFISELTGITNDMLVNAEEIDKVLPRFLEFSKDSILVAHNADFDMGFIIENANKLNINFKPIFIDTLYLARAIRPDLKNHKLNTLAKEFKVSLLNHHRASDDAKATAEIFIKMIEELKNKNIEIDKDINKLQSDFSKSNHKEYQTLIYVKNKKGLKNLYTIVSKSNLEYFGREPGIPENILKNYQDGLLLGTGNYKSKLFKLASLGYSNEILEKELSLYDFVGIVPLDFSTHLIKRGYIRDAEHLKDINKKLVDLAIKNNKIPIAIGDVYYINQNEYSFRNVLKNYPRKGTRELSKAFYLKNTQEMLNNYDYFDENLQKQIVIDNTYLLDNLIENISPIADGTFPPRIKDAEKILRDDSYEVAKSIYGEDLPEIVEKRLERELNSIISNGYAALYIIAKKLVKKSNEEGYLVGSRGSVGSSFAATMAEITEVNPLPPHYICSNCKIANFDVDIEKYTCGVDLPDANCEKCGKKLIKEGFDIPFEVFLGFEGDKEPDIDLNFASVYQSRIHKYTEELFGSGKVFRAGTLGTIAEKTAYGMAIKYNSFYPEDDSIKNDNANINRVKRAITGVKRSTGQHAGGLIIVPDDKDIEDFTPVQYPADKKETGVITTHFDYHAIDKNLLKLDLLGHNSPTVIRLLSDMSGIDAVNVDLSDEETMSIFRSTDALKIKHEYTNISDGSLGVPEFGTLFVRSMLKDTLPSTFEELIRISGLSHGTSVWLGNAQDLIKSKITDLKGAICTRDDIMNYLISKGLDNKSSFDIMEKVRKGKGVSEEEISKMKSQKVPNWYIDSCQKIQYMFPKAHAVAYVMMSFRIAYFKVHHPEYFYAVSFTNEISDFKYEHISKGLEYLTILIKSKKAEEGFKVDNEFYIYELAEEMYARDIKLAEIDLYKSHPTNFTVLDNKTLLPPLMAIPNVSESMALRIADSRNDGEFISKEDFITRTRINKTAIESMNELNIFDDMQDTNQIDFFNL